MGNTLKQSKLKSSSYENGGGVKPENVCGFPHKVDVDHVLKHHAGNIGFVQIIMVIMGAFTLPPAIIFPVFGNTELPHRCRLDPEIEKELSMRFSRSSEDNFDSIAALVGPWPISNSAYFENRHEFGCKSYLVPLISVTQNTTGLLTTPCNNGYVYKYSSDQYPGGIINEWDLVCDRAWMGPFSTAMYMVGMMVGIISGGIAGNYLGRRQTALIACLFEAVSIVAVSLSTNFWLYILSRFVLASASSIKMTVLLVLCMEMTTARQRSIINGIWSFIQYFLLRVLLSPLAYWFPRWQWLHGMACMLSYLSFPSIYMFPESPRWLLSQHRKLDALHEIYKIYLVNRKVKWNKYKEPALSEDAFINLIRQECAAMGSACSNAQESVPSKCQLKNTLKPFKDKNVRILTLQCFLLFTGQLAITFGLLLFGNAIRANIYLVNFLNSATQLPATVIPVLLHRYCKKRKIPIVIMYVCSTIVLSIAAIYNLVVEPESDFFLNICMNLSLILLNSAMNMVYMYVPELFASEARTLGLGVASGFGRLGGVLCPFINTLQNENLHGLPIFIYIGIHILLLLNLVWLPDTRGRNLQESNGLNRTEEVGTGQESEASDGPKIQDDEEENDEDNSIWAPTLAEMTASTHVIQSSSCLRDDF
nr:solute carrier family 22 [Hymenolepis microstoma]